MAQLDAIQLSENLRKRLVDFSCDQNFVRDDGLEQAVSGPLVRATGAGRPGQRPLGGGVVPCPAVGGDLEHAGGVGALPCRPAVAPFAEWKGSRGSQPVHPPGAGHRGGPSPPGDRPALLVTAGTGAGKTESFLLPVLNDLFSTPRAAG